MNGFRLREKRRNCMATNMQQTTIGLGVSISGNITLNEDLCVEGKLKADEVTLNGCTFTCGKDAETDGEVSCQDAIIHGHHKGNVTAAYEIYVGRDAVVDGDLKAPRIKLEPTATVNGRLYH